MNTLLLGLSTLFMGLMAGLFYAWSISVTPGIGRINDIGYLQAFQAMNRAILNPVFFLPFMGLLLLLPVLSFRLFQEATMASFGPAFAATLLYIVAVFGLTAFGNVPLNNLLEELSIHTMSAEQMETFRLSFETKWNRLNLIRTFSSVVALGLLVWACLQRVNQ